MKTINLFLTDIEGPLGLNIECDVAFDFSFDKGEKVSEFNPPVSAQFVIEGWVIKAAIVEDCDSVAICLVDAVLKEDIYPVINKYIADNTEKIVERLVEEWSNY